MSDPLTEQLQTYVESLPDKPTPDQVMPVMEKSVVVNPVWADAVSQYQTLPNGRLVPSPGIVLSWLEVATISKIVSEAASGNTSRVEKITDILNDTGKRVSCLLEMSAAFQKHYLGTISKPDDTTN